VVVKNEVILDTAAEVLARRPNATLQSIANAAGISRTTIFHRFATRDALLEALSADTLERIGAVMRRVPASTEGDPVEVVTELTRLLMQLGPRTVFLRIVPGWGNDPDDQWPQVVTPLAVYIATLQATGRVRSDQPFRWMTASYIGLLFAAWDEIAEGELGAEQAASLVVQTWLAGAGYTG